MQRHHLLVTLLFIVVGGCDLGSQNSHKPVAAPRTARVAEEQAIRLHGVRTSRVGTGPVPVWAFDGIDDYAELSDTVHFEAQEFTIEMWVKPAAESRTLTLFSKRFNSLRQSFQLQVIPDGVGLYCSVLDADGKTEHQAEKRRLLLSDRWMHIVFTCNRKWLRTYVDGKMQLLVPMGKLPLVGENEIPYSSSPVLVGSSDAEDGSGFFVGEITDFRIHSGAIKADEVVERYHRGNSIVEAGTLKAPKPKLKMPQRGPIQAMPGESLIALVKGGEPAATIVVPDGAKYWTQQAASWLQHYIGKSTGAMLKIVSENTGPTGTLISLGHTEMARQAGIHVDDVKWDGCKLQVRDNVVYLIGRNVGDPFQHGKSRISDGNCRAAVTFLEDILGIRWFLPGPEGEVVPRHDDLRVPSSYAKTFNPAIAFSGGRFPFGTEGQWLENITPGAIANNFRLGIAATSGGHVYYEMVPKELFDEHPEYFAYIDGKRTSEGHHLCSTNPAVKELLLRGVRELFDNGYDVVSLGQEDGYYRCQCDECEKLDGYRFTEAGLTWADFQETILRDTPCERLFLLHKAVIDEVQKSHPDRTVLLFGYAPTAWPSKVIDKWGDKVWVELTNQGPEYIKAWRGKTAGITGYVYWFDIQLVMGMDIHATALDVANRIRYLYENDFRGFYHFPETNFGFEGPAIYVMGKLMGDPYLDHESLVEEFCHGVYGNAAGPMLAFFNLLYTTHEQRLPFHLTLPRPWKWLQTEEIYLLLYPPETLDQLEGFLIRAERDADTVQSKGWVHHSREYFDFTKLLTGAITDYRTYLRNQSTANWTRLKSSVEAFNRYRLKILNYDKAYADRWFPGHAHFCNWLTGNVLHESKVYYTDWLDRRDEALERGVERLAIGYGGGGGYSYIKAPLTLDFSQEPEGLIDDKPDGPDLRGQPGLGHE